MKRIYFKLLVPVFILLMATGAKAQLITTIAGIPGVAGSGASGGPATDAQLGGPVGVCVDRLGNVYIADSSNNIIRMVTTTGKIYTVAGGGTTGLGDGGPALAGQLINPTGVAVDTAGNLFIADLGWNRIREVIKTSGIIITIAGGGTSTSEGVPAISAQLNDPFGVRVDLAGNVYIADRNNNVVREVSGGIINTIAGNWVSGVTLDGGPATSAELNQPSGAACDVFGNIYFADQANNVVRRIDAVTNMISTVAGNNLVPPGYSGDGGGVGSAVKAQLNAPSGVAVNSLGTILWIADYGNNVIRQVALGAGTIATVVGKAPGTYGHSGDGAAATNALLAGPTGVAYNSTTNALYIAEAGGNTIRMAILGGNISTIAGVYPTAGYSGDGGPALVAHLSNPTGVSYDVTNHNLYIADAGNDIIRMINATGTISLVAGKPGVADTTGDYGPATAAALNNPTGVVYDPSSHNLFIADNGNSRIREAYIGGSGAINTIAGTGCCGSWGAGYYGEGLLAVYAELNNEYGVTVDPNGDVIIADTKNDRVRAIMEDHADTATLGRIYTIGGNLLSVGGYGGLANYIEMKLPSGVAVSKTGIVFIADQGNNIVREIDAIGVIHTIAGNGIVGYKGDGLTSADSMELNMPMAVAYDDSTGFLYIADAGNNCIRKLVTGTGLITTFAGQGPPALAGYSGDMGLAKSAQLNSPSGVDVDKYHNVYIADRNNNRIREVNFTSNIITTVAGTGLFGFLSDGGPATAAEFNAPYATVVDPSNGDVYVADRNNNIVRKVSQVSGLISTYAGTGIAGFSGDAGPATAAQIDGPISVALDKTGNLYISDQGNNVIRMVAFAGAHNISTVAGTVGLAGVGDGTLFYYATGICVDKTSANLYIADGNNNKVKKLTLPVPGAVSTVAGTGTAGYGYGFAPTACNLNDPIGVTTDPTGNLYIADFNNNTVAKVKSDFSILTLFAGDDTMGYTGDGGPATNAKLDQPTEVASDPSGNIFIADMGNQVIRLVNTSGIIKTVAGNHTPGFSGDGGAAYLAQVDDPFGVSVDTSGNYYIADRNNDVIRKVVTVLLAGFTTSQSTVCQDSCITFINTSIGNTDSLRWTTTATGATMSNATGDTNTICYNNAGNSVTSLKIYYHGKSNMADTAITINATPVPVINVTGYSTGILSGAYITFQWNTSTGAPITGATNASFTAITPGNYSVTVDSAGCVGTSVVAYLNPYALGLSSVNGGNNFWLSNPDNNTAMLHAAQVLDNDLSMSIYNATGQDILDDNWKKGSNSIQVNGAALPPGLYIIKLSNQSTSAVLKWLKE